jgi:membrane protein
MSESPTRPPQFLHLIGAAFHRLFADEAVPLAGNIAFRTIFSLFPFLIFLTALAGFFGTEDQAKRLIAYLMSVAPQQLVQPLAGEITSILTVPRAGLMSLAAALTIWSAMAGVDSIRVGLNRAYDLKEDRSLAHLYILEVLFVIGAAVVFVAISGLLVVLPLALHAMETYFPGTETSANYTTLQQFRFPLAMLLLFAGLHVAHRVLPARRLSPRKVLPGILLTLLVWIILAMIFAQWLQNFNAFASTYASLSGFFAAMFFIYMSALVMIFGGELNRVLDVHAGTQEVTPPPAATP